LISGTVDKDGYYSEYGATQMQEKDYRDVHFLRGRQTTDANGEVTFISIYPGWYRGRAPHIHVEALDKSGKSLLVTQIAFPENISSQVYSSALYSEHGQADTTNSSDNVFSDGVTLNMGSVTGNINDGFTITKTIVVNA
jgi:protocatechuate 3,4-dioxygenase beta subunit